MNISVSFKNLKEGFHTSFWVANGMELFERLAYYGQATILSIFLRDHLKFNEIQAGQLSSIFGGLIYLLPIFAGALADKFGFKKAFSIAFGFLAIGYFLIGLTGMNFFANFYSNFDLYPILSLILIFTSIGGSFIKPSVLGTVALSTTNQTKSLGYAIYYWLVNTGAALGPLFAYFVRDIFGIEFVYIVSSISCALMFLTTRIFYNNPPAQADNGKKDLKAVIINLLKVLKNIRFITFLLIFSLYWILFWQFFIIIPFYITDYISKDSPIELILSTGAWTIIIFQIPINRLTKNISTQKAILIGFILATFSWFIWFFLLPASNEIYISIFGAEISLGIILIVLGIFIFSIGEQTQAPRFYEYVADLAPKEQAALFQGYAFLPIAIAWGIGGTFGGWIYQTFSTINHRPEFIFLVMTFVGFIASILMILYNKCVQTKTN